MPRGNKPQREKVLWQMLEPIRSIVRSGLPLGKIYSGKFPKACPPIPEYPYGGI